MSGDEDFNLSEDSTDGGDFSPSEDEWKPTDDVKQSDSEDDGDDEDFDDDDRGVFEVQRKRKKPIKKSKTRPSLQTLALRGFNKKRLNLSFTRGFADRAASLKKAIQSNQLSNGNLSSSNDDDDNDDADENIQNQSVEDDKRNHVNSKIIENQENDNPSALYDFTKILNAKDQQEIQRPIFSENSNNNNENDIDISTLLAIGEKTSTSLSKPLSPVIKIIKQKNNRQKNTKYQEHNSDSEWDEVENIETVADEPNECVEITIKPSTSETSEKRSRTELEIDACIRRRINNRKKSHQILLHKVHLLCLIGHGNYVNCIINDPKLMKVCSTLIPSQNCYPKNNTDIKYFESITKWYKTVIGLKNQEMNFTSKRPTLDLSLALQIKSKLALCRKDFILIYICLLRSMGFQCRLVMNLVTIPLRPPISELCSVKNPSGKVSNTKRKSNESINKDKTKVTKTTVKPSTSKGTVKIKKVEVNAKTNKTKMTLKNDKGSSNTSSLTTTKNTTKIPTTSKTESTKIITESKTRKTTTAEKNNAASKRTVVNTKTKKATKPTIDSEPTTSKKVAKNITEELNKEVPAQKLRSLRIHLKRIDKKSMNKTTKITGVSKTTTDQPNEPVKRPNLKRLHKQTDSKSNTKPSTSTKRVPQLDGGDDINASSDNDNQHKLTKKPKLFNLKKTNSPQSMNVASTSRSKQDKSISKTTKPNLKKLHNKRLPKDDSEDSDFVPSPPKKLNLSSPKEKLIKPTNSTVNSKMDTRVLSTSSSCAESQDDKSKQKQCIDIWVEAYAEKEQRWISIDLFKLKVDCIDDIRKSATSPISYVLAWNNDNSIKDISARYCPLWHTVTRKGRIDKKWFGITLNKYTASKTTRDINEDKELDKIHLEKPLPKVILEYKHHPLYALERDLLKFEAIYPKDALILGYVRNEPVYARECVHTLHSREIWVKQARVVKLGEKPYKIVKSRPKWDRLTNKMLKPEPLEIFGKWQTQKYVPPVAENGIVPRNAYGNVELFKPEMLPKNCVHLQLPGLNRTCKKLNVDCAQAVIGFDFHSGSSHPTFDGFVICEEFAEKVTEQYFKDQEEAARREVEKYEQRVYGNWKKLIKGLLIRESLQRKYNFAGQKNTIAKLQNITGDNDDKDGTSSVQNVSNRRNPKRKK